MLTGHDRFNVLFDPWVPLATGGHARLASYRDILVGKADAAELVHPRDDLAFFGRMLLSALTQALFTARDIRELTGRLIEPLPERKVDSRLEEVRGDFELVGKGAFLQDPVEADAEESTSQLFLDLPNGSNHLLFRPVRSPDGLCPPCAVVAAYGAQAFAPAGGRGKSPGVRGTPPVTTLVVQTSVRQTMWANTLAADGIAAAEYTPDGGRPWRPATRKVPGHRIGLLEGLFWQPRTVCYRPAGNGACSVCGREGSLLKAFGFGAKSKVDGGFYRHPHSPFVEQIDNAGGIRRRYVSLRAERPAWVGLADLLSGVRGGAGGPEKVIHAAPVVDQWISRLRRTDMTLLVLCYSARQAKILTRFVEGFPLSLQRPDIARDLRTLIGAAEEAFEALRRALRRAHSARAKNQGGFWLREAESAFWQRTEAPFWTALDVATRGDDEWRSAFYGALRSTAMSLFEQHTDPAALDNGKQSLIASARAGLAVRLYRMHRAGTGGVN